MAIMAFRRRGGPLGIAEDARPNFGSNRKCRQPVAPPDQEQFLVIIDGGQLHECNGATAGLRDSIMDRTNRSDLLTVILANDEIRPRCPFRCNSSRLMPKCSLAFVHQATFSCIA